MKRKLAALAAAVIAAIAVPATAHATGGEHHTPCAMPSGWYANPDEQTRLPEPTAHGLKFSGNQLIHHAGTGTVEHLTHGTFLAFPQPDQPSFFSVEVADTDGTGYATLRWNTSSSKWDMVTGGQIYSNTDPAALVDMPAVHKSHRLISFGVGYTANPPGTVTTTVSKVWFGGHSYDLRCKPAPSSSSASPSASVTTSANASPSASTSSGSSSGPAGVATTTETSAGAGGLAITGPSTGLMVGGGAVLLAGGVALYVLFRRRRARFVA